MPATKAPSAWPSNGRSAPWRRCAAILSSGIRRSFLPWWIGAALRGGRGHGRIPLACLLRKPPSPARDHALVYLCERGADLNGLLYENMNDEGPRPFGVDSCPAWLYGLLVAEQMPLEAFGKATWRATGWALWPPTRISTGETGRTWTTPAHPLAVVCVLWGDHHILTPLERSVTPVRAQRAVDWLLSQGLSWDDPWEDSTVLGVWAREAPAAAAPYVLGHRLKAALPAPPSAAGTRPRL